MSEVIYSAEELQNILCETCGNARGWLWPSATDGNYDHDYVERCDACDRFADDWEAWEFLKAKLDGYLFDAGEAFIRSIDRKAPYIDNVRDG